MNTKRIAALIVALALAALQCVPALAQDSLQ